MAHDGLNLFNNKFRINELGDFEADGNFYATKTIKVHDGFEINKPDTEDEETVFQIFISGMSTLSPLPPAFENSLVFRTQLLENPNKMQYVFWNEFLNYPDLVLNQGGIGRVTLLPRSVVIGAQKGLKPLDNNFTLCNEYSNLAFDTDQFGADFGVEHDVEILGALYVNSIEKSSGDGGVSIGDIFGNLTLTNGSIFLLDGHLILQEGGLRLDDGKVVLRKGDLFLDDGKLTLGEGNIRIQNGDLIIRNMAGGGNRTVMVNDQGRLYAE